MTKRIAKQKPTERDLIRQSCCISPFYLMQVVLYPRMEGYKFARFHPDWQDWHINNLKTLFLGPRGSLKTTIITITLIVYRVLRDFLLPEGPPGQIPGDPLLPTGTRAHTIGIGSEDKTMAAAMVTAVRRHFERRSFQEIFGDMTGTIWRKDELSFREAKLADKEANVTAFGMDSSAVASKHFKELFIDDMNTFENTRTLFMRDQMTSRFNADVLPTLQPQAHLKPVHIFGTRYDPDDMYGRILEGGMIGGVPLVHRRVKALNDDDTSFWEEKFPADMLIKMRREKPTIFALQYQNDAAAVAATRPIQKKWAVDYRVSDIQTRGLFKVLAIDPGGVKQKEENSPCGIGLIGADPSEGNTFGNLYTLFSDVVKLRTWDLARKVLALYEKWKVDVVVVEDVCLQSVFEDVFAEEARKQQIFDFNVKGIPMSEIRDKITLAASVEHFWTQGRVFIDREKQGELFRKLEDYPRPGTDDVNAVLIGHLWLKLNWVKRGEKHRREVEREERIVTHFGRAVRDKIQVVGVRR